MKWGPLWARINFWREKNCIFFLYPLLRVYQTDMVKSCYHWAIKIDDGLYYSPTVLGYRNLCSWHWFLFLLCFNYRFLSVLQKATLHTQRSAAWWVRWVRISDSRAYLYDGSGPASAGPLGHPAPAPRTDLWPAWARTGPAWALSPPLIIVHRGALPPAKSFTQIE